MKKLLIFAAFICSNAVAQITGSGATFPAPIYSLWTHMYHKETGEKINYQSVGSGAGIKQITARIVDFGASDMPLKDDYLKKNNLIQFPTVIGGVVPIVNIPGINPGQLKLDGATLANIYLGKITKWNDSSITALNPGINLPDATIATIRRSDGSGTSFLFTNYLSKVSQEWKEKVGEGTSVNWPNGVGGKGNEGVAAFISRLPNSIGYVEYSYVKANNLTYVRLANLAGKFVEPSQLSFKVAASNANWDQTFYQVLTNQPGKDAWPITGATFILLPMQPKDKTKMVNILKFFDWAYTNGDKMASDLAYIPMPENVKQMSRKLWLTIEK